MQRRPNKPRRIIYSADELPAICNAAEAGLFLRINPENVYKLARDGALKGAKLGQEWRFRKEDLLEFTSRLFEGGVTA